MRASARVAWRVAAAVAFAATAALAVTLTRGAALQTALTSARNTGHSGAAAVAHRHRHRPDPVCRTPGPRIWVNDGDGVAPPAVGSRHVIIACSAGSGKPVFLHVRALQPSAGDTRSL